MLDLKITQYIRIRNHKIEINGQIQYSLAKAESTIRFLESTYRHFGVKYRKFFKMDCLSKLGFLASELILKESEAAHLKPDETSVILCNASSSLNTDQKYQKTISDIPSPAAFVYTLPNIVVGEICIRNSFRGENAFFIQRMFDCEFFENYVRSLFETTEIKQCLTGWVEMTMDNNYDAVLYLISQGNGELDFTESNLKQLFQKTL